MPVAGGLHYFSNQAGSFSRPPLIMIHGAGGHHLYWPPQLRRNPEYRVFAVDLPGHGKSAGIGRQRIEDYVEDVIAFMAEAGLNAAVWIGHSMGGAIALQAALQFPSRVLGLVLIGTGARLRVDPTLLHWASRETGFAAAIKRIGERSFSRHSDQSLRDQALRRMTEMRPTVLSGDLLACDAFDSTRRLPEIVAPTAVICGSDDELAPLQSCRAVHASIRNSQLHIVERAGHMVMLERPDETARLVDGFLRGINYRPGSAG